MTRAMSPVYAATATLFVGSGVPSGQPGTDIAYASLAQSLVMSYQQLAETRAIAGVASRVTGVAPESIVGHVNAEARPGVQILKIRARGRSPALAANVANAVAGALIASVEDLAGRSSGHVGVRLVDPAVAHATPISPRAGVNLAFGGLLGLVIGVGLALARESVDPRLRTAADVERELGLPVLGTLPTLGRRARRTNALARHAVPRVAEPSRSLAVTLASIAQRDGHRRILITSADTKEGKTTVAAHLGLALAEHDRRTALIEVDFHRPSLRRHFPSLSGPGLESLVWEVGSGVPELAEVAANLTVLAVNGQTGGRLVARAPEVAQLLDAALGYYDHVLLDAPPALAVSDTRVLARHVDTVLFVVRAGVTRADDVRSALVSFRQLDVAVAGVALVGARVREGRTTYYYGGRAAEVPAIGRRAPPA